MESLSYAFEGRRLLFTDHTVESIVCSEPILPEMTNNSFLSNQCSESFCEDTNNHSRKSSTVTLNSIMEFGERFSSDDKLAAPRKPDSKSFSIDEFVMSSSQAVVSAKRAKITTLQSSNPTCQVHGCNKDLSSSKDYHKRHKVCDVHSKTAVVIVNGIQQRFCQQCSRFHILAEFDEGKRSCRKRLAGHNERRRKPQFDSYLGSTYMTTHASKTSLLFSSTLPATFFDPQRNNPINLKLEHDPSQISQLAANIKFRHSLPKSAMGKKKCPCPSKHSLNIPSSVQESSVGSNSIRALSLLSAQSRNVLRNASSGTSISNQNYHSNLRTLQNSAQPLWKSTSEKFIPIDQEISLDDINRKSYLCPEGSETVSLLELSLQLQRVEQQKYSGEVKMENGVFCKNTYA